MVYRMGVSMVKSFANPPAAAVKCSLLIMMLFYPDIDEKNFTWKLFQKELKDPNQFMQKAKMFQPDKISPARLLDIQDYIR